MKLRLASVLLVLIAVACHQAIMSAPDGAKITLFCNPSFIPAHGGVSVITALIYDNTGNPVADGTVVQFFTSLGRIDEQGKTNDGVARVNLISDSRSGTAKVTAISGAVSAAPIEITVGSALPNQVIVTAFPTRLTDRRASLITATVLDAQGNPVANVPVIFQVAPGGAAPIPIPTSSPSPTPTSAPTGVLTEWMDSQGSPTFTDNNGQAQDVMRTDYDPQELPKNVTVTATTSNGKVGSVTVTIN